VALLFIAVTALMKFYTLPLLLVYILIEKRVFLRIVAAISIFVVTPLILLDISRVSVGFPNPTFVAFGVPSPGLWLNFFAWRFGVPIELQGPPLYLLGYLIYIIAFYNVRWLTKENIETYRLQFRNSLIQCNNPSNKCKNNSLGRQRTSIDKILAISKDAFGDTFIPPIPHNPLENKMASILSGVDVSNLKGVVPEYSDSESKLKDILKEGSGFLKGELGNCFKKFAEPPLIFFSRLLITVPLVFT
jgi:hypothetical protein